MGTFYLRPAECEDCELLWQWANENEVRQNSFNTELIPLEKHKIWLKRVLADDNVRLYILQENNEPVGQVRLVYIGKWQISYSIAAPFRGQGYGRVILQLAENALIETGHVGDELFAEVKDNNIASQRIFMRLGYAEKRSERSNACAYTKVVNQAKYHIDKLMPPPHWTVMLLSNNINSLPLLEWLEQRESVAFFSGRLNLPMLERIKPSLVISYNYQYIVTSEVIAAVQGRIINMHTSLLPWNRGSSPNLWSVIDDTPKGVTIHVLDEGLDTGDILLQKEVAFDEEKDTLCSSYECLNQEIVKLLQENWNYIMHQQWNQQRQSDGGSMHTTKDLQKFLHGRTFSYDMTIADFKREFNLGVRDYGVK